MISDKELVKPVKNGQPQVYFTEGPLDVDTGSYVTVSTRYIDAPQNSEIHVNLVDAETRDWYGGATIPASGDGTTTTLFETRVPPQHTGKLVYEAYVSAENTYDALSEITESRGVKMTAKPTNAVGTLCYPSVVRAGDQISVNTWFTLNHARPIDMHVNVLNHDSKEYYGGAIVQMDGQQGEATVTFDLPRRMREPLMWKVYITPRDEPFPNFLDGEGPINHAETGMNIPLGPQTIGNCEDIGVQARTPSLQYPVNWVEIIEHPNTFNRGSDLLLDVQYNLETIEEADLTVTLMKQGENTEIASYTETIQRGKKTVTMPIATPAGRTDYIVRYRNDVTDTQYPIYVIAYLTPVGGVWEDVMATDRVYTIIVN